MSMTIQQFSETFNISMKAISSIMGKWGNAQLTVYEKDNETGKLVGVAYTLNFKNNVAFKNRY